MKKIQIFLLVFLLVFTIQVKSNDKNKDGYQFKSIADVPVTSVKNQYKSGTCWSFAATSFLEAEILRLTEKTVDLSEMFFVYHAYNSKAKSFVQLNGNANFGPGGQAHDVMDIVKTFGFVDETTFSGLAYGTDNHEHNEIDEVLRKFVQGVAANKNGIISPVWPLAFAGILNAYLGVAPQFASTGISTLEYSKSLKINPTDYIEITSYNHHDFYSKFRLEIQDNWSFDANYYNLPIDEMMEIINNALKTGYSVCWDGDVSDAGFSHNDCVAVLPETKIENLQGTEMSKWQAVTTEDLKKNAFNFSGPVPERIIDQKARQVSFENHQSTDDHLMHLTGIVNDKNGTLYYRTKNSWGTKNDLGGYLNMSASFLRLNTIAIMVHKSAIPENIRKKLGV